MDEIESWLTNNVQYCIVKGDIGCGKSYTVTKTLKKNNCNQLLFDIDTKTTYPNFISKLKESYNFKTFWNYIYVIDNAGAFFNDKGDIDFIVNEFPDIKMMFIISTLDENAFLKKIKTTNYTTIHIKPPTNSQLKKIFKLSQSVQEIKEIMKESSNDIRQLIYKCKYEIGNSVKDKQLTNMYSLCEEMFDKNVTVDEITQHADIFILPTMFHENYIKCNKINVSDISYDVCIGDIFHTYMYKNANWDYMDFVIYTSVVQPLSKCNKSKVDVKYGTVLSKIMNCQTRKKTMKKMCEQYNVSNIQELQCVFKAAHYYKDDQYVKIKKKELNSIEKFLIYAT